MTSDFDALHLRFGVLIYFYNDYAALMGGAEHRDICRIIELQNAKGAELRNLIFAIKNSLTIKYSSVALDEKLSCPL